ncbi:MAG: TlyA family RNA methyltransferase [Bdellovibrionales bacterium]|nr:TlyA family RNA methyltransferase [Bdellovibrionales bacterium]
MSRQRVDKFLMEMFPQWSRSRVQDLIQRRQISFLMPGHGWQVLDRASLKVHPEEAKLWQWKTEEDSDFVSRGALKLQGAVECFNLNVAGGLALDIGLSTGGFSHFLISQGIKKVLGVDVGRGQLHESLQSHPKLLWADKINAREPIPTDLLTSFFVSEDFGFDWIVIDVSFISLEKIIPQLPALTKKGGQIIALVKPQFELSKQSLNRKGVVRDPSVYPQVLEKISVAFEQNTLKVINTCESPIEGENGNKEFFILAQKH